MSPAVIFCMTQKPTTESETLQAQIVITAISEITSKNEILFLITSPFPYKTVLPADNTMLFLDFFDNNVNNLSAGHAEKKSEYYI